MDAAQRLFMERGFDGSSMDAIAEAAGVAKATVYARFPDKETLLKASISAKCQSFLDPETLDWRFGRTLRDGLLDIARRFLSLVTDPEAIGMHRLMTHEGQRSDRLPSLFFQSAIRPTVLRLAQFLEDESKFNQSGLPVDSVAAAWRFLGMVKGEDHMRAIFGMTPRPREEIDAHIEACVDDFIRANFPNA
ncbi:MAG: TetR/AcrR family transcriptional regulator [Parvularculaceae bacterium]|nr:TetR/AcrR family transcriptional regulator [Parvularculaceae bacterium]